MKYLALLAAVRTDLFTILDVEKYFPDEKPESIRTQLSRFVRRELVRPVKRGLYAFPHATIDELTMAGYLYQPSYISLETALHYHGVIPDIPLSVTSVTTVTTKKITTDAGVYYYHKIPPKLFWGYSREPYAMAFPEKALLDFTYLRGKHAALGLRVDWSTINKKLLHKYDQYYR